MVKNVFLITCGLILGALAVENKHYFSRYIPVPVAVLPDGGAYEGSLNRGQIHGKGRITWPNGDYYDGEFSEGLFHGQGTVQRQGVVYHGGFELGNAIGKGTITYSNGNKYQGEVALGVPDGWGVLQTEFALYEGDFKSGRYHGNGKLINTDGSQYEGAFEKGLFHGDGVYRISPVDEPSLEGSIAESYQGRFANGEFSGKGIWVNQHERYEGDFVNWLFDGEGIYTEKDGQYVGQFSKGLYQGKGVYKRSSGAMYEGDFVDGIFHGKGILTTSKGDVYNGGFRRGAKHGKGVLKYAEALDGVQVVKGKWKAGKLMSANHPQLVIDEAQLAEQAIYQQTLLLNEHLSAIEEQDPESIDLYFVGVAGDASQGVFRREMGFVKSLFNEHFQAENKAITLVNSPLTVDQIPLATVTSIQKTLNRVAQKMDAENDILFLYLSSHGSSDFNLKLAQPGLMLPSLGADDLGRILKDVPVKHKVVVISACFAGGFVKHIKDEFTLIMVAAEEDKSSFGCHDRNSMTYFGEALFKDSLVQTSSFVDAFYRARDLIKARETEEEYEHSNPLIFKPKAIVDHLAKWRSQQKQNILPNSE